MSVARRVRAVLRGRSLAELGDRARQAGHAAAERAGLFSDTAPATAEDWRSELCDLDGRPFADVQAALDAFRSAAPSRFFAGTVDIRATLAAVRDCTPGAEARTLDAAACIASGRLRLLGFPALDYGQPPDWHRDPVHDRRAPLVHWSEVPYLDEAVVGDHKITWELNRHQWLVHLAKAYAFTGEERWAELALAHIDAWIEANACKRGINWASSLEVAFRAVAWLWVLYLLRDSRALTAPRFGRLVRTLAVGGRHVERHLSTWFSPNTHLTGEALGLLYLGCALPGLNDAQRWRALGLSILARHMPRHVRGDGTYIEQSTHYARYTVDFLAHAVVLAQRSALEVPVELSSALRRGATFLGHVTRPDGTLPLIGDDDGGRLLFLDPRECADVRPTLAVAAAILGDSSLGMPGEESREEIAWLLGPAALRALARLPATTPAGGSRDFPDGGVATLRDGWGSDASLAVLDCGPHGMGNGGHAHADLGSIDLTLRGRSVIADPGTGSYLSGEGWRDAFRGAAAHAVPRVDGQGSAEPGSAFSWARAPRVLARMAHLSPECDIVAFSHDGFRHLADPVAHRRALLRVRRDCWIVIDIFRSVGPHDVSLSFPLAPGLHARLDGACAVIADARGDVARFLAGGPGSPWSLEEAWASPAYGRREPTVRLQRRAPLSGTLALASVIQPADAAPILALQLAGTADALELAIDRGAGAREILNLGEQSGAFIDAAGHRTTWGAPAPGNSRQDSN